MCFLPSQKAKGFVVGSCLIYFVKIILGLVYDVNFDIDLTES